MSDGESWSQGIDDSWGVRVLVYVAGGVPLGVAVVAVALLGRIGMVAVRAGRYSLGAAVALVFLSAGVLTKRADPLFVAADATPDLSFESFRFTWLAVAAVGGAGFVVLAAWAGSVWFFAAVFAGLGMPLATAGLFTSEGEIDVENRILRYGDEAFVLDELVAVRRFSTGGSMLVWCRFHPGTGRTPTLLVLPSDVAKRARGAFDRGVEAEVEPGRVDHATRLLTGLFAGLLVALAVLSVIVLWGTSLIAAYVGGSLALLGLLVFVLGRAGP
jgi:hypothetical protein